MTSRFFKHVVQGILFSAAPAFCSYAANSKVFLPGLQERGIIGGAVDLSQIQDTLLWVGIILSVVLLGGSLVVSNIKRDSAINQRNALIQMNKAILASTLSKCVGLENIDFDIRIFVPKHLHLYRAAKILRLNVPRKFVIRNVELIAHPGITKKLQFEVYPRHEGLVGLCYDGKKMMYDDDLENTNDVLYDLGPNQIDKTSSLMWSICCPIIQEDDTVHAIIALDGKTKITLSEDAMNAFRSDLTAFSRMLFDTVPQLFR